MATYSFVYVYEQTTMHMVVDVSTEIPYILFVVVIIFESQQEKFSFSFFNII